MTDIAPHTVAATTGPSPDAKSIESSMRPHCRQIDACKAKTPGKHCPRCVAASPERRARQSAAIRRTLAEQPEKMINLQARARANSASEEVVAKRNATLNETYASTDLRIRISAARKATLAEKKQDPAFMEMLREQGRRVGRHNLMRGMTKEVRAKAAPKIRAARLAWCPPEYWDFNADLKAKGFPLAERQGIIGEEVARKSPEAEARRAIADFDRRQRERHAREQSQAY